MKPKINWKIIAFGVGLALFIILTSCASQPSGGDLYKTLAFIK